MADAEARVTITARDATAAAFSSAQKNLRSVTQGITAARRTFALFGLALSGRVFANWIGDALEVNKLTVEQAASIGNVTKELKALQTEFGNLTRHLASEFAPTLEAAAEGWRRWLFPTGDESVIDRISRLNELIVATQKRLDALGDPGTFMTNAGRLRQIKDAVLDLSAYREELDKLWEQRKKMQSGSDSPNPFALSVEEQTALESLLYELNKSPYGERRLLISKEEEDVLENFLYEINRSPYGERRLLISQEEEDALETFIYELNKSPYGERRLMLSEEEEVALEEFIYDLNHDASRAAVELGEHFRDSFGDWILGADRSFKDLLKRMATDMAVSGIFDAFASMFSGSTGAAGKFFSSFFGGARAEGGPVSAGKGYLVGERGPELFMPGMSGSIVPNGGGMTYAPVNNVTINGGGNPRETEAAVARAMQSQEKQTIAKIKDLMARGRWG